jgi:hypothetical protein
MFLSNFPKTLNKICHIFNSKNMIRGKWMVCKFEFYIIILCSLSLCKNNVCLCSDIEVFKILELIEKNYLLNYIRLTAKIIHKFNGKL